MRLVFLAVLLCACKPIVEGTGATDTTEENETIESTTAASSTDDTTDTNVTAEQTTADTSETEESTTSETMTATGETTATSSGTSETTSETGDETTDSGGDGFDAALQYYCEGWCSPVQPPIGGYGCDQEDADAFCQLLLNTQAATASSWKEDFVLDGPGFCCEGPMVDDVLGWASVCWNPGTLLPEHANGHVILRADVVCVAG